MSGCPALLRLVKRTQEASRLSDGALIDALTEETADYSIGDRLAALINEIGERFMADRRIGVTPAGLKIHGGDLCSDAHCVCHEGDLACRIQGLHCTRELRVGHWWSFGRTVTCGAPAVTESADGAPRCAECAESEKR